MVDFAEIVALIRETDGQARLRLAAEHLRGDFHLDAMLVTFADQDHLTAHRVIYNAGYDDANADYLRDFHVTQDPRYRELVETQGHSFGWDEAPDFLDSYPAKRWLLPAGHRSGASLSLHDDEGTEIGSIHVNTRSPGWNSQRIEAMFAYGQLASDVLSEMRETKDLGLTTRELCITKLVATGASNPQIAKELWISPSTVKTHIENIMRKLDAGSRVEVAVTAAQHGLL